MKIRSYILIGLFFCFVRCSEDSINQVQNEQLHTQNEACFFEKPITDKDMAKDAITGMWKWIKTCYPKRGGNESIETPLSVNKEKTFEFLDDELRVFEDKVLVYETNYEIKYWGEGTNTVDELLMISFSEQDPAGYGDPNVLFLSASSTCMRLVNSYNDGGGDLFLSRVD